jgi:uncharacterized membrane protein YqjE
MMNTRMFLWAVLGFALAALASWLFDSITNPLKPLTLVGLAILYVVAPLGSFWMLFVVIRHEKHPLPWILLAFLPYFSVGYYFERVRRNRVETR